MLYNPNCASLLLGCLMNNPDLLTNKQYPLEKSDFTPVPMHRVIFVTIARLYSQGVRKVTEVEMDNYLQNHPTQYEILEDGDWMDFIETVKTLSNTENYESYYNIVRKFSLLRDMKEQGINISEFYDEAGNETKQNENLSKLAIRDILHEVSANTNSLVGKYDVTICRNELWLGDGWEDTLLSFEETPIFGKYYQSPYLNSIFFGCRQGHLTCESRLTGKGKTTNYSAVIAQSCAKELYLPEVDDFVPNPNYDGSGGFYLHTEMETVRELQPKFIAYVADVSYKKLILGKLDDEEKKRAIKAGEILLESRILAKYVPDFTVSSIRDIIKVCAVDEGLGFGCFDYIQQTQRMLADYRKNVGGGSRDDMAILALVTEIKACAEDFGCYIHSGTQLNPDKVSSATRIDENLLSGAKSTATKLDNGYIVLPPTKKELKLVDSYFRKKSLSDTKSVPNSVTHIYKSRFDGERNYHKVFQHVDFQTGRSEDLFITDADYKKVKVERMELDYGIDVPFDVD